jgi:hypothetical protein
MNKDAARRGGKARMAKLKRELRKQGLTLSDYQKGIRGKVSADACRANGRKGALATIISMARNSARESGGLAPGAGQASGLSRFSTS